MSNHQTIQIRGTGFYEFNRIEQYQKYFSSSPLKLTECNYTTVRELSTQTKVVKRLVIIVVAEEAECNCDDLMMITQWRSHDNSG